MQPEQEVGPVNGVSSLPGRVTLKRLRGASGPSASGRGRFLKLILGLSFCDAWLVGVSAGWLTVLRVDSNASDWGAGMGGLAQDCLIFKLLGRFACISAWPAQTQYACVLGTLR